MPREDRMRVVRRENAKRRKMRAKKKVHRSSIISEQCLNLIQRVVLSMGHLWNPTDGDVTRDSNRC